MPRAEQTVAYGTETVLPSTALTLPMFIAGMAKISNSVYRQTALNSIVIGTGATSTHTDAVVIGRLATTNTWGAVVAGAVAIGYNAQANAASSISIGSGAYSFGGQGYQIVIGYQANASGQDSQYRISIGYQAGLLDTSLRSKTIAIGFQATGLNAGDAAIAIGDRAVGSGIRAIAIGAEANVAGHQNAICLGYRATSSQVGEFVVGASLFGAVTLITFRPAAGTPVRHRSSVDGWAIRNAENTADIFHVDTSVVADEMRLLLWDVSANALVRVSRGAADSAGLGLRALAVGN